MFCSKYLRGRAGSLASHRMFFAGGSTGPRPRTLGGRERGRALNRGPITPDRRRAQPQRPPVLAARPPATDRHRAHHAAWRCRNAGEGPWRRLAAQKCRLPSRKIGSSSAEFSITHFSQQNSSLVKSITYGREPAKIALLLFKFSPTPSATGSGTSAPDRPSRPSAPTPRSLARPGSTPTGTGSRTSGRD